VKLRVPPNSSVLDVLLLYAGKSGVGWRMRRAGQRFRASAQQTAIISTEVQPWDTLSDAHHTASLRQEGSMIQSLGQISARTGIPICVIDGSPLSMNRGTLDHALGADAGSALEESLNELAAMHMPTAPPNMRWEQRDGVVVVRAQTLDRFPALAELLEEPVRESLFQGSLPELARWLTRQLAGSSGRRIAGGEITPDEPTATLHIEPGATLEEVLVSFAASTRRGWYLVIWDRTRTSAPHPTPWHGAFLSNVLEWGEQATPF
jgi:hypothetical protein